MQHQKDTAITSSEHTQQQAVTCWPCISQMKASPMSRASWTLEVPGLAASINHSCHNPSGCGGRKCITLSWNTHTNKNPNQCGMSIHSKHPLALITTVRLLSAQLRFGGPEKGRLCTSNMSDNSGRCRLTCRAAAGVLPVRSMRVAAAGERAQVLLRSFRRSLAGFGGRRLGSRPMRAIAVRSVELYWPAITGADSLCLRRWSLRSRSVEVLLRA
jgi:hypothetical protein